MPSKLEDNCTYNLVESVISNYWQIERGKVLDFENNILKLMSENEPMEIFTQIQNYMLATIKANSENKQLFIA